MMYISVFPIAISVRRTNVYEESSLGIYANTDDEDNGREASFVGAHLRKQLSFDLWYIFLGLFIITISEGSRIQDTKDYVSVTELCTRCAYIDNSRRSRLLRFCLRWFLLSEYPWDGCWYFDI